MAARTLFRIDSEHNMARFYKLDVQPTLFGQWALIREWGRIGRAGTARSVVFATLGEAEAALRDQRRLKERRGYSMKCLG